MAAAVEDHLGQLELLCDETVPVVLEHERLGDLVPGQRQVALWMRTNAPILHKRELDTPEAVHVTALAEERHREAPAKLWPFAAIRSFALRNTSSVFTRRLQLLTLSVRVSTASHR